MTPGKLILALRQTRLDQPVSIGSPIAVSQEFSRLVALLLPRCARWHSGNVDCETLVLSN